MKSIKVKMKKQTINALEHALILEARHISRFYSKRMLYLDLLFIKAHLEMIRDSFLSKNKKSKTVAIYTGENEGEPFLGIGFRNETPTAIITEHEKEQQK